MHILAVGLFASPVLSVEFHSYTGQWLEAVRQFFVPGEKEINIAWLRVEALFFGLLMILNESNILIRFLLKSFSLTPLKDNNKNDVDENEYNTGRIIGFLERIFVFIFVLLGQYTALGFILAAKGVTRLRDFESRTFAEYVLIGTLLSTLFAMAIAYLVLLFYRGIN